MNLTLKVLVVLMFIVVFLYYVFKHFKTNFQADLVELESFELNKSAIEEFSIYSKQGTPDEKVPIRIKSVYVGLLDVTCDGLRSLDGQVNEDHKNTKKKCAAAGSYEIKYNESNFVIDRPSNSQFKPVYKIDDER